MHVRSIHDSRLEVMGIEEGRYILVKVLLVDDHTLFRDGMANFFAANDIEVVGMAGNGMESLEKARNLKPMLS